MFKVQNCQGQDILHKYVKKIGKKKIIQYRTWQLNHQNLGAEKRSTLKLNRQRNVQKEMIVNVYPINLFTYNFCFLSVLWYKRNFMLEFCTLIVKRMHRNT